MDPFWTDQSLAPYFWLFDVQRSSERSWNERARMTKWTAVNSWWVTCSIHKLNMTGFVTRESFSGGFLYLFFFYVGVGLNRMCVKPHVRPDERNSWVGFFQKHTHTEKFKICKCYLLEKMLFPRVYFRWRDPVVFFIGNPVKSLELFDEYCIEIDVKT